MIKVKNLTNSPFDLPTDGGSVRLPAFGEVEGDFTGEYFHLLQLSMAVSVIKGSTAPIVPAAEPVGDWANPKPVATGGKPPVDEALAKLRKDYTELTGKKFYHGWNVEQIQERIDKALAV